MKNYSLASPETAGETAQIVFITLKQGGVVAYLDNHSRYDDGKRIVSRNLLNLLDLKLHL